IEADNAPAFFVFEDVIVTRPDASVLPDEFPATTPDHLSVTPAPDTGRPLRSRTRMEADADDPLFAAAKERTNWLTSTSRLVALRTETATIEAAEAPRSPVTVSCTA